MGTHAAIIEKTTNGYRGIYCRFDGYVDGVGRTLQEHYLDPAKVRRLIDLGDVSCVDERVDPDPDSGHSYDNREPGVTVAYMRDRGETDCEPFVASTLEDVGAFIDASYEYVFDGHEWTVNGDPLLNEIRKIDAGDEEDD